MRIIKIKIFVLSLLLLGCTNIEPEKQAVLPSFDEVVQSKTSFDRLTEYENARLKKKYANTDAFKAFFETASFANRLETGLVAPIFSGNNVYKYTSKGSGVELSLKKTSLKSFESGKPSWVTLFQEAELIKRFGENYEFKSFSIPVPNSSYGYITAFKNGSDVNAYFEYNLKNEQFEDNGFRKDTDNISAIKYLDENNIYYMDFGEGHNQVTISNGGTGLYHWNRGSNTKKLVIQTDNNETYPTLHKYLWDDKPYILLQTYNQNNPKWYSQYLGHLDDGLKSYFSSDYDMIASGENLYMTAYGNQSKLLFGSSAQSIYKVKIQDLLKDGKATPDNSVGYKNFYEKGEVRSFRVLGNKYLLLSARDYDKRNISIYELNSGKRSGSALDIDNFDRLIFYTRPSSPDKAFYMKRSFSDYKSVQYIDMNSPLEPVDVSEFNVEGIKSVKTKKFTAISHDGVEVDYTVLGKSECLEDSNVKTMLYVYGAFGFSNTPSLNPDVFTWVKSGGKVVYAHTRGGREQGKKWHDDGKGLKKKSTFYDIKAVMDDMVKKGIAKANKTALYGGSAGGLAALSAVSFAETEVAAIVAWAPPADVINMNKYSRGEEFMEEYGDYNDPKVLEYASSYSPINTFKTGGKYPPIGLFYFENDDRVPKEHVLKMYYKAKEIDTPVYFYNAGKGGHDTFGTIENTYNIAYMLSFMDDALN